MEYQIFPYGISDIPIWNIRYSHMEYQIFPNGISDIPIWNIRLGISDIPYGNILYSVGEYLIFYLGISDVPNENIRHGNTTCTCLWCSQRASKVVRYQPTARLHIKLCVSCLLLEIAVLYPLRILHSLRDLRTCISSSFRAINIIWCRLFCLFIFVIYLYPFMVHPPTASFQVVS